MRPWESVRRPEAPAQKATVAWTSRRKGVTGPARHPANISISDKFTGVRGSPDPRQASSGSDGVVRSPILWRRISLAPSPGQSRARQRPPKSTVSGCHCVLRSKERSSSRDRVTAHPKSSGPAARFSGGRAGPAHHDQSSAHVDALPIPEYQDAIARPLQAGRARRSDNREMRKGRGNRPDPGSTEAAGAAGRHAHALLRHRRMLPGGAGRGVPAAAGADPRGGLDRQSAPLKVEQVRTSHNQNPHPPSKVLSVAAPLPARSTRAILFRGEGQVGRTVGSP
jgi:hypothetical protein